MPKQLVKVGVSLKRALNATRVPHVTISKTRVIITENKINFLTSNPCTSWGDLDTHGFAILSCLRQYFPHTRSFATSAD